MKIQLFEMWSFRKMFNVSRVDEVPNLEFSKRKGKEAKVINNIKSRKLQYFRRMKGVLAVTSHTTQENIREIKERGKT